MNEDIDYMAQQVLYNFGVMPTQLYETSMSDYVAAQRAKAPKDRPIDPLLLAQSAGLA